MIELNDDSVYKAIYVRISLQQLEPTIQLEPAPEKNALQSRFLHHVNGGPIIVSDYRTTIIRHESPPHSNPLFVHGATSCLLGRIIPRS